MKCEKCENEATRQIWVGRFKRVAKLVNGDWSEEDNNEHELEPGSCSYRCEKCYYDDEEPSSVHDLEDLRNEHRRAPESEGLEPLVAGGLVVGYHSDINGPDAALVEFKPTRAELMTLAYRYLERHFGVHEMFATGHSGSFEIREAAFTGRRFKAIAEALSPGKPIEEFQQFIDRRWAEIDELRREAESEAGTNEEDYDHG